MHAKHALRLDCDLGALMVLLIGISAVSFLAFSACDALPARLVASADGIHSAS
jgi:hypothetical protein